MGLKNNTHVALMEHRVSLRSLPCKFNCITVNFERTQHSIHAIQTYQPYALVGPTVTRTVQDPLVLSLLHN